MKKWEKLFWVAVGLTGVCTLGAIVVSAVLFLFVIDGSGSSGVNCDRYIDTIDPILLRWDDANELASVTSRIAISGPLGELQGIKQETLSLSVPDCADEAHTTLVAYMSATIEGYLAFAGQNDGDANLYFNTAAELQDRFFVELEKFE